jgi:hypothetical protein
LKITGTFDDPVVEGIIKIKNAEVMIDYLKVPVFFSADIETMKNFISFGPFIDIKDKNGNTGTVKGFISHKSFKDLIFNMNINELRQFQVLNTTKLDNELYYGQAFVDGNASFNGPFDNLDIKVNAKTTKGTHFYLPISDGDASGLPSYVHFKTTVKKEIKRTSDFPINSLVMDIEATNDAEIEIVFDETMGDKITGTGTGNITMEMNKSADFYMFGTYKISSGKYLFTAFDVINKPFILKRGGTVTFYGDPFDAKLDLVALNEVKADPNPLMRASQVDNSNSVQNVSVQSELYLKGNLFSPEISFGLNFPRLQEEAGNSTGALSPIINRIKSDKDEVSRQVFSLLLFTAFIPPSFAQDNVTTTNNSSTGSNALTTATSDLLSAQVSNWLNKIDPNWKVNIIYKNGNITLPNQYGVNLVAKLYKDKITLDGSYSNYSSRPNINLEYKVTRKGNVKIKAYSRSTFNIVNTSSISTPINTTGIGVVYTKDFNIFWWFKKKKKKKTKG